MQGWEGCNGVTMEALSKAEKRMGLGMGWEWKENGFGSSTKSKPLLGLICLYRSTQTCPNNIAVAGLSRPTRPAGANLADNVPCPKGCLLEGKTPIQDAAGAILVQLHHYVGNYGGLGCLAYCCCY